LHFLHIILVDHGPVFILFCFLGDCFVLDDVFAYRRVLLALRKGLREDRGAEEGHQFSVDSHLDQVGVAAQDIDQLDAHRFDVEGEVGTEVEEDLQTFGFNKLLGKVYWRCAALFFSRINQQHFKELE
jgi:hypothetical protein